MASLAQRGIGIVPKRRDNLSRGERLQIMLSPDELTAVDDFRFQHRMPSRAAAVRELFRIGLANAGLAHNSDGKRSSDIGVLEAADLANPPGLRMVSKDGSSA
jgi:hypothetical protein